MSIVSSSEGKLSRKHLVLRAPGVNGTFLLSKSVKNQHIFRFDEFLCQKRGPEIIKC
jgi:hypothetical protein